MAQRGRPPKPTEKYNIERLIAIIDKYTTESKYPILKECCYENDLAYDHLLRISQGNDILRRSLKRLYDKREFIIEKGAQAGKLDKTFSIFALKQPIHGWTDKQQVEMTGAVPVVISGADELED